MPAMVAGYHVEESEPQFVWKALQAVYRPGHNLDAKDDVAKEMPLVGDGDAANIFIFLDLVNGT
jgi:hypothetical protein